VYVIVQSVTITEDSGCGGSEVFTAGQAFEEPIPRVHQVRNTGTEPAVLFATLISPPGQPLAINTGGPLCGPPTNKDECKNGGWMTFNFPRSFEDQGDCVSNVNTGKWLISIWNLDEAGSSCAKRRASPSSYKSSVRMCARPRALLSQARV